VVENSDVTRMLSVRKDDVYVDEDYLEMEKTAVKVL
jgi:hypothetical protein